MKSEHILFWSIVACYGVSAFCYIFGFIGRQEKLFTAGLYTALPGFVLNTAFIARRWIETGISPFIEVSESITFGMFMTLLVFLIVQFSTRRVRPLGVLIMPVAFVLMGWAGTLMKDAATSLVPALQSAWIWVHIIGASTGFSSVLVAAGISLLYLLKEKKVGGIVDKLPEPGYLDNMAYRFVAGGFVMYGVMIVSGAFWANQVKGSYWNWDAVEVWSLISWLIYGIYLHLRITFGWRGVRLAWYALIAAVVMIVSYWGIPFTVETFHQGFRIKH